MSMSQVVAKISNIDEESNILKFTLSNVNVSYANALRRVLLSDIPIIVFKTQPYKENNVNILINKTRMNNELLKQRISSIPIHINNINEFPYEDYEVELDMNNETNSMVFVTTENFKIRNIATKNYLSATETKAIFPPDPITGDYIDIIRLRPKLSDVMESEKLKFSAKLAISTAGVDAVFNVVATSAYGNTLDPTKIKDTWEEKEKELKEKYEKEEIASMKADWLLLDAKRLYIADSFDFILETIGIYSNFKLMNLASAKLIEKLYMFLDALKSNADLIIEPADTMENCYVIIIENEDYTIGKIMEYYLYNTLFVEKKEINFVGFLKKHPHDTDSFIKMSYKIPISKDEIIVTMEEAVNQSALLLKSIKDHFDNE
mgnify:CR=1 FL=1